MIKGSNNGLAVLPITVLATKIMMNKSNQRFFKQIPCKLVQSFRNTIKEEGYFQSSDFLLW